MDVRQITETYHVAPQIDPTDMEVLAAHGFTKVIDNRPNSEIPPSHHADVMEAAAKAAGLDFVYLPITHETMTPDVVRIQSEEAEKNGGKTLAFCASGTRCTVIWSLWQATSGNLSVDEILAAAAKGGYELSQLRPRLENLAKT